MKDQPLWIFSLNHDLLVEMMCSHFRWPLKNGFNDSIFLNGLEFERLRKEDKDHSRFRFFNSGSGVNLIKLHGSLDLFVYDDFKGYVKLKNTGDWNSNTKILMALLKDDVAIRKYKFRTTNHLTYEDAKGVLQFLRMTIMSGKHKFSSRLSHTMDDWFFRVFKSHINHVKTLHCVGYSFGDKHVNAILYDWLAFSVQCEIIIVNPTLKEVPFDFRHLKDQFKIEGSGFLEFLNGDSDVVTKATVKINRMVREDQRRQILRG